jgi:hypothetical protein
VSDNRIEIKLEGQPENIRMFLPALDVVFLGLGVLLFLSGIGVYLGHQGFIPSASLSGIGFVLLAYVAFNILKFRSSVAKNRSILFTPVREKVMEVKKVKLSSAQIASMWCHEEVETDKYRMRFEHRQGRTFKVGIYPAKAKKDA